jgi:hypothetical protein
MKIKIDGTEFFFVLLYGCEAFVCYIERGTLAEGSQIIKTKKCTNMSCIILKHTLKHLKGSYIFRSTIIIREQMQFLAEVLKC